MANKLKAYVRFDGSGRIVPGSLILNRFKPKVGNWQETPAYECCNQETYPTVLIGTQSWSTSNLDIFAYRNGDPIPQVTDPLIWSNLTTGAWCYYENNTANGTTYGKLYNWYAVNDPRGLAPVGYHIPTDAEWTTLTTFLGGDIVAGGKMKETGISHWTSPNTGATNVSGFTGLPGGFCKDNGVFYDIYNYGLWWTSTEINPTKALYRGLYYNIDNVDTFDFLKTCGFSVRLMKD
jgi:uncharacterized protein (TIGR02145 family)